MVTKAEKEKKSILWEWASGGSSSYRRVREDPQWGGARVGTEESMCLARGRCRTRPSHRKSVRTLEELKNDPCGWLFINKKGRGWRGDRDHLHRIWNDFKWVSEDRDNLVAWVNRADWRSPFLEVLSARWAPWLATGTTGHSEGSHHSHKDTRGSV